VVAFMDKLGLKKAHFAGNSMGGVITLWIAMDSGHRIDRMALLGTPAYPQDRPRILWPLSWPVVGRFYEWLLGETSLRFIVKSIFVDKSKITEEMIAEYVEPLKTAAGRRAVAQFVRTAIPPDFNERIASYGTLQQPALVLVGDSDGTVDRAGGERLFRALPRARFEWVERCGHAPQEDAPERVFAIIRDFFAA
jgi:pimeloyl-ACP methyl ester carboxylesterase